MKVSGPNSGAGAGAPDATTGVGQDEAAGPEAAGPEAAGSIDGSPAAGSAGQTSATGAADAIQRTESSGRAFAEKLAAAGTPPGATPGTTPSPAPGTTPPGPAEMNALAGDLDAGRLTPGAAVDRVLEQVLAQQVGADAPAALRERVRAALQDALATDPMLAEKLRRLGA